MERWNKDRRLELTGGLFIALASLSSAGRGQSDTPRAKHSPSSPRLFPAFRRVSAIRLIVGESPESRLCMVA